VQGALEQHGPQHARHRLELRQVDQLPAPRLPPVPDGGQHRERSQVSPRQVRVRVAEAGRRAAGLGHEERVAGERLERRPVAHVVAVRPRQAEARHAHADHVRAEPHEHVVVEPQVGHHPRAEVVDDDVRDRREPAREVQAARIVQVEQDAPLAAHERAREAAAAVAEVEAPAALDLDHVGAQVGEDAGRHRPGDHPGEVEDANAVERAHQGSSARTSSLCSPRRGGRATRHGASARRNGAPG